MHQMLSKNYAIFFLGGGGGALQDHMGSQGEGQNGRKKDRVIS